ncbi:CheR family methyltransferase [Phenylobacterium sp.]|uniref:CheR family methyltransferase n=1 Tax=Phenylobacterium sp. TaxID=1871053 RepID=UPI00398365E0
MTPFDREVAARLCAARAGLRIDPDKAYLLESRLAPVARREGFASLGELMQVVRDRGEERLVWAVVEAMAVSESGFFRDPEVFDALVAETLPALVRARGDQPVRIWNAACGTGQEVFSLAMLLEEDPALGARVELFASDLNERSLEKAQAGLYSQFEVQRGLPARRLLRHFEKRDEMFALSPRVRQMVRWRRVNLTEDLGRMGGFDLILCRHVAGGLTEAARVSVLKSLAGLLDPGGVLVLGRSETLEGVRTALSALAGRPGLFAHPEAVRAAA